MDEPEALQYYRLRTGNHAMGASKTPTFDKVAARLPARFDMKRAMSTSLARIPWAQLARQICTGEITPTEVGVEEGKQVRVFHDERCNDFIRTHMKAIGMVVPLPRHLKRRGRCGIFAVLKALSEYCRIVWDGRDGNMRMLLPKEAKFNLYTIEEVLVLISAFKFAFCGDSRHWFTQIPTAESWGKPPAICSLERQHARN